MSKNILEHVKNQNYENIISDVKKVTVQPTGGFNNSYTTINVNNYNFVNHTTKISNSSDNQDKQVDIVDILLLLKTQCAKVSYLQQQSYLLELMYTQACKYRKNNQNPRLILDSHSKDLFENLHKKLEAYSASKDASYTDEICCKEITQKLTKLLDELNANERYFGINLSELAKATLGQTLYQQKIEVVKLLRYMGKNEVPDGKIADICMEIQNLQKGILDEQVKINLEKPALPAPETKNKSDDPKLKNA